ncbi:MAG TPA: Spy/CpxP family protein refolding chaperone [Burkholderiaceae bacterium]|nr:Spy/CpxP family protein refolding chaperone [Burkholderiaceae bacterium]
MSEVKAGAGRQRRAVQWLAASAVVIAAVIAAVSVHAQGRHGAPGMDGGPGGGMMMFGGPMMGRNLDRMLDGLNATEAQRTQIRQIAMAAAADLRSQRESGRALRDQAMQIFTAPTVDAGAAESLRQQMLARHDQASKRMLQAMLDIAKVLTPEQRAKIGARMKERQAVMQDRMQRMQREHGPHRPQPPASAAQK